MTGLLASLGLLPAALSHAIGSETQRPLAVVVVCGTVSAFALTLILMPVAFYWMTYGRERIAARMSSRTERVSAGNAAT
jgi:cobalt-zinc-cadmium resistance protein CzcA